MSDDTGRGVERRAFLKGAGVAGAAIALGGVGSATPGRSPGPRKDEILVGVTRDVDDLERSVEKHVPGDARVVHSNDRIGYVAVKFPSRAPDRARENFVDAITKKDHVRYAEPNATLEALAAPDDPLYGYQYVPQTIGCEKAWETTRGDPGVTIAIVDQGIQYDHPDLAENMDDGVSRHGRDFADDDGDPYPVNSDESHGTRVAGIAAGGTDNGTGHAGVSDCSLLSARALDEAGRGSISDIADAITWAADRGADVINLSLGGDATATLENAVSYAYDQGSLPVAAAGNGGSETVAYPAAYQKCLAVSALHSDGSLASYSNYGDEVELCAPGTRVVSTTTGDGYARSSGTSMAAPVVAGVAGLALSNWDLSNDDLRLHLTATAANVGLPESQQGAGRVDAAGAVNTTPSGEGGGATCGDRRRTVGVSDQHLSEGDDDCWYYRWEFDHPCQVVVDLEGPDDATFDLYANTGSNTCPSTDDYDYRSYNWGSDERIVIDHPDDSAPLYVKVDAYSGSGSYDLTITEKGD